MSLVQRKGKHFKTYGLAKKYDPEKFELALAAQGARDAGGFLWKWAWKGSKAVKEKMADFGSESEQEVMKCNAHRIRWSTSDGDVCLSAGPCTVPAKRADCAAGRGRAKPRLRRMFLPRSCQ